MKRAKTQNDDIQEMLKTLITKSNMRNHGIKSSSDEICYKFANNGNCAWGDNCRFKHTKDESVRPIINKSRFNDDENFCGYMVKYGNCRKGNACARVSKHAASFRKFHEGKSNLLEK